MNEILHDSHIHGHKHYIYPKLSSRFNEICAEQQFPHITVL